MTIGHRCVYLIGAFVRITDEELQSRSTDSENPIQIISIEFFDEQGNPIENTLVDVYEQVFLSVAESVSEACQQVDRYVYGEGYDVLSVRDVGLKEAQISQCFLVRLDPCRPANSIMPLEPWFSVSELGDDYIECLHEQLHMVFGSEND